MASTKSAAERPGRPRRPKEEVQIEVEIVRTNQPLSAARKAAGQEAMLALANRLLGPAPQQG